MSNMDFEERVYRALGVLLVALLSIAVMVAALGLVTIAREVFRG